MTHMCGHPKRPEEDIRSPELIVAGDYELPDLGYSRRTAGALNHRASLQLLHCLFIPCRFMYS